MVVIEAQHTSALRVKAARRRRQFRPPTCGTLIDPDRCAAGAAGGWQMRSGLRKASVVALLMATLAPSIGAQWPSYPTPGVPRTADGKPNLEAPAPRTADGKVDFSGIWMRAGAGGGGRGPGRGGPPAPTTTPEGIPLSQFGEVAGRGYRAPAPAVGGGTEEEADGRQQQGQPRRVVSPDRPDAVPQPSRSPGRWCRRRT